MKHAIVSAAALIAAAAFLLMLPPSSQAQDSDLPGLDAEIAAFQQRLDEAHAEAMAEVEREEARAAEREAELRERGVTMQGGSATTPTQHLLAKVEERIESEKVSLIERIERFLGMCVEEVVIALDPWPRFSIELRSRGPDGTCS